MTDHYYTKIPTTVSDRHTWQARIGTEKLTFTTDAGVFSKMQIDYGSALLAETAAATCADLPHGNVLDVGCGYGPIGIYLAKKMPMRDVHLVDINERAVELARINAEANHVASQVSIYSSYLYEAISDQSFALIVSNPPIRAGKKVVHEILEKSKDYLVPGGQLQIVIQKKTRGTQCKS